MAKKLDDTFIKQNKLRISYYAGSGEAYIKKLEVFQDNKWIENTNQDNKETVEIYFNHTISSNEHNDVCGSGSIHSDYGTITKDEFSLH